MDSDTVARYEDVRVTVEDLDAYVLSLPPKDRPLPGQDLDAWYKEQIKNLIQDRLLLKKAEETGLRQDANFLRSRREEERRLILQLYFKKEKPELQAIDDDSLKKAYEARKDQLKVAEKRSTFHIFRRCENEAEIEAARTELAGLRDRVLQGENFQRLAEKLSDSEARHRGGAIGWIQRGLLDPVFEKAIFALQEGVPSDPVVTDEGVHLFYVDTILPEKELSFEDAKQQLAEVLLQERRLEALDDAVSQIDPPPDSLFVDRKTFNEIVKSGDNQAVLLHLGDTEFKLQDLRKEIQNYMAANSPKNGPDRSPPSGWKTLEFYRKLVLLEYYCKANHLIDEDALQEELRKWERFALINGQRRKSLLELAEEDESKLKLFYQGNIGHFSHPLRVKLRIMDIPLGKEPVATMTKLETAAATEGTRLDDLGDMGGTVRDLDWKSMDELHLIQPKLPPLIASCPVGQIAAPYRNDQYIEVAEVVEREEAKPIPFDEIRPRVAALYSDRYTSNLYHKLVEKWVQPEKLEINPDGLAALRARDLSETDVAPEEIDKLLQELGQSQ